ncbi:DUF732 domain-containing protein [Mycobacterium arosiense]|uniref:DUF732 domain-containing protein n=1 Tax=Mycobacterium arosiense ATCC BAA-1401 = DSM 45069 TaxID=1265311 RepID=A0A1W9ZBX3_MYCAI|nr:DUF732 domain-containing protein [Mycobacterium arosiense]ORA11573.1 hypothetical protein BST14_18550 [Mycobacterium arosiense ATCC BAA-1401 = DSM 45069]
MLSTNRAGALVTALVVLTGVVMLPHGAASADPDPDDQFVALLDQKQIPALDNVPSLIATAHRICRQLDGGMPADGVVADMRDRAFNADAAGGRYPPDRVARTIARFISASVEAYCPNNQPKIASLEAMGNRQSTSSAYHAASSTSDHRAPQSASPAVPLGETAQPEPPQLPPPPPTAQIMTPPRPVATPSPRQQPPPPPQEPLPGPQQEPPAAAAPGGPPGGAGPGGGGAGPESPPPGPPGRVRLAP